MANALTIGPQLPHPALLERRCIALATLDAILSPDWQYRYYSFNRHWDREARTRMASMRNGSGDDCFLLFFPDGTAALKGYDHESPALDGTTAIAGVAHASEYFEVDVPIRAVARMFQLEPLTPALATEIRAGANLADLASDLEEIGYPIAG
jgi:hypothetical protein